jgi:hypothetical protein
VPSAAVLGATVVDRLHELVDLGCLVSVSRSRDGGSVAITVTSEGEWERAWFRDEAEAILKLDEWLGILGDERAASPPAAKPQRRPRRA